MAYVGCNCPQNGYEDHLPGCAGRLGGVRLQGYQVGDLVVLISGSCPMTVTEVHEESQRLSVAWMEQASEGEGGFSWKSMQRSVLPIAAVVHATIEGTQ